MEINRENYEAYLLDLVEGRLTDEDARVVRNFLRLNPDCAMDLVEADRWKLDPEPLSFREKSGLYKELPGPASVLQDSGFDLFSIARLEGDLLPEQVAEHESALLNDPSRKRDWQVWQQIRLRKPESLVFPGKEQLKRSSRPGKRVAWISILSSAAALALVFILLRSDPFGRRAAPANDPEALSMAEAPAYPETGEPVPTEPAPKPYIRPTLQEAPAARAKSLPAETPAETELHAERVHPESVLPDVFLTAEEKLPADDPPQDVIPAAAIRMAQLEHWPSPLDPDASYDRIKPLTFPVMEASTETLSWASLTEKGLKQSYRDFVRERDLSLLTLASSGIDGLNRLTGSDLALDLSRDPSGGVSGFRFRSNRMTVSAPVRNTE